MSVVSKIYSFITSTMYVIVLILLVGFLGNKVYSAQEGRTIQAPGQFIEIQDTKYHILCDGPKTEKETIILEPDHFGCYVNVLPAFHALKKTKRVCVYDRFNKGFTTTTNKTYSLNQELKNLKTLLEKTEEVQRFIFVGEGFGLKYAQKFARNNKNLVVSVLGSKSSVEEEKISQKLHIGLFGSMIGAFRVGELNKLVIPNIQKLHDKKEVEIAQHFLNKQTNWDQAIREFQVNLTYTKDTTFLNDFQTKTILSALKK
eukprot:gene2113-1980_t